METLHFELGQLSFLAKFVVASDGQPHGEVYHNNDLCLVYLQLYVQCWQPTGTVPHVSLHVDSRTNHPAYRNVVRGKAHNVPSSGMSREFRRLYELCLARLCEENRPALDAIRLDFNKSCLVFH